jgi:hypothetical protein
MPKHPKSVFKSAAASAIYMLGAVGCAAPSGPENAAPFEPTAEVSQALTAIGEWTDWSGLVRTKAWSCDWSAAGEAAGSICTVPDGWVLVGGGAEIEGTGDTTTGPLLTSSVPLDGFLFPRLKQWYARSQSLGESHPHRIRGYVIGLAINGITEASLRSMMNITCTQGASAYWPHAAATIPSGNILIGGGATTFANNPGQFLFDTRPADDTWFGQGKDHYYSDYNTAMACSISIPRCPPGLWGLCLKTEIRNWTSGTTSWGWGTALSTNSPGFVLSSIGGRANFGGAGRLLTDLIVVHMFSGLGTVWVYSKDHILSDPNSTTAYTVALAVQ